MNFNTGIYEKGRIIIDRKMIFKNYKENNLYYDVISLFPLMYYSLSSKKST